MTIVTIFNRCILTDPETVKIITIDGRNQNKKIEKFDVYFMHFKYILKDSQYFIMRSLSRC